MPRPYQWPNSFPDRPGRSRLSPSRRYNEAHPMDFFRLFARYQRSSLRDLLRLRLRREGMLQEARNVESVHPVERRLPENLGTISTREMIPQKARETKEELGPESQGDRVADSPGQPVSRPWQRLRPVG